MGGWEPKSSCPIVTSLIVLSTPCFFQFNKQVNKIQFFIPFLLSSIINHSMGHWYIDDRDEDINSESDPTCRYFLPIFASKTGNKNNMRLSSAFWLKAKLFNKKENYEGNFEFQRFYTMGGGLAGILVMNWCVLHFLFLWKYGLHILAWNSYTLLIFLFPNFWYGVLLRLPDGLEHLDTSGPLAQTAIPE